ncbi:unnamed protein product [Phytophthora fragariaefolia]|uniref:Unnamed protein product n=1 Tax=Phytophthora fragariaefolia TaxID=1490495 RepID=A0A9W6TYT3_9STRA|nr:unnamed protein product [Phytophthora fragariaefolia]
MYSTGAKPNDRIVSNIPDTSGELIPTSPHVIDENAPTSCPSSSGSGTRMLASGRRYAFNLANESDSEYKASETESSGNDEGGAGGGDVDEGDAEGTESNHSVYNRKDTSYVHDNDIPYLSLIVSYTLLDDPNIVLPGEKPEDFVRLDSDDENDVNSV